MNEEIKVTCTNDVFKYSADQIYDYIYDLQQENQQLKEPKERLKNCYSSMTIIGRQQGRAYEQAQNYIIACNLLGLKDIKITLVDSEDKKRIEKAIEYIESGIYYPNDEDDMLFEKIFSLTDDKLDELLQILKGEDKDGI